MVVLPDASVVTVLPDASVVVVLPDASVVEVVLLGAPVVEGAVVVPVPVRPAAAAAAASDAMGTFPGTFGTLFEALKVGLAISAAYCCVGSPPAATTAAYCGGVRTGGCFCSTVTLSTVEPPLVSPYTSFRAASTA